VLDVIVMNNLFWFGGFEQCEVHERSALCYGVIGPYSCLYVNKDIIIYQSALKSKSRAIGMFR
jgi:hypothetical protein